MKNKSVKCKSVKCGVWIIVVLLYFGLYGLVIVHRASLEHIMHFFVSLLPKSWYIWILVGMGKEWSTLNRECYRTLWYLWFPLFTPLKAKGADTPRMPSQNGHMVAMQWIYLVPFFLLLFCFFRWIGYMWELHWWLDGTSGGRKTRPKVTQIVASFLKWSG